MDVNAIKKILVTNSYCYLTVDNGISERKMKFCLEHFLN